MLRNYFNSAIRNLLKHKFYSVLNILGLSIGLTCFLLISLFIKDELAYDKFHKDANRIYRVDFSATLNGSDHSSSNVGAPTAGALRNDYPEVEDAIRLNTTGNWFIKRKGQTQTFKEEHVLMADSNFFEFFTVKLLYGDPKNALNRPNTMVLDRTTATKIFGETNPVGEVLVLDNQDDFEVTGVYEDLPDASHFHQNILLSMSTFNWANNNNWLSTNFNTYVKLKPGLKQEDLESKFPGMIEKYCAPLIEQFLNMNMEEFQNSGNALGFSLFPLTDIHLHSDKEDELEANGDIKYIYIFAAVALFILILACINFMNLATARSANRAKEVGVRKVMGAFKQQLINQFLTEALIITLISFLLAYGFTFLSLPSFNALASKSLDMVQLLEGSYLFSMFGVMIAVGLLAGSYPAFFLSAFRPVEVLKGKVRQGMKSGAIRSTLVVFQFSISIVMIIGTAVVFDQLSFIQNKKLGYDKDQIMIVDDVWILRDQARAYKTEAMRHGSILNSTLTDFTPTRNYNDTDLWFKNPSAAADEGLVINEAEVDHDFIQTMGIELVDGRTFSKDFSTDSSAVLINETAVIQFGYEDPIGDKIYQFGGSDEKPEIEAKTIIGVMKDFHYRSLKDHIDPLIVELDPSSTRMLLRVNTQNLAGTIDHLKMTWETFAPGQPFAFSFLNQEFENMYESEKKIGEIFTVFAILAIIIACLGLFGLAAFTAEQRTKEIGIRKALGASVTNIINLLSRSFIRLVGISFLIAAPLSYLAMNSWLDDFAYRTSLNPLTFLASGVIAFVIAWVTMSYQSWKAAKTNPITSLRNE